MRIGVIIGTLMALFCSAALCQAPRLLVGIPGGSGKLILDPESTEKQEFWSERSHVNIKSLPFGLHIIRVDVPGFEGAEMPVFIGNRESYNFVVSSKPGGMNVLRTKVAGFGPGAIDPLFCIDDKLKYAMAYAGYFTYSPLTEAEAEHIKHQITRSLWAEVKDLEDEIVLAKKTYLDGCLEDKFESLLPHILSLQSISKAIDYANREVPGLSAKTELFYNLEPRKIREMLRAGMLYSSTDANRKVTWTRSNVFCLLMKWNGKMIR